MDFNPWFLDLTDITDEALVDRLVAAQDAFMRELEAETPEV